MAERLRRTHIHLGPGQTPRERAIDAIYRFTQALDRADPDLIRSAFTSDGIIDLSGMTPCTARTYEETKGIDTIVSTVLTHVGSIDSAHHLSNFRATMNSDETEAEVTVYAWAQHFRAGEGQDPTKPGYIAMGNFYWADVVKDGDDDEALWKIRKIEVSNMWSEGDLSVLY